MHAVLRGTGSGCTEKITCNDEIRVRSADSLGCLCGDPAWTHITDLTADSRQAEVTLRLLLIKAVKGRIYPQLFHAQQHLSDCRIRSLINDILLGRKGLSVFRHCLHVVFGKVTGFLTPVTACLEGHGRYAVLIEPDEIAMRMDV